jgi:hypothetical protein
MDEEAEDDPLLALRLELARLRESHQYLSAVVETLQAAPLPDQIQIARLKKRKLALKDQIIKIENALTPDLIA